MLTFFNNQDSIALDTLLVCNWLGVTEVGGGYSVVDDRSSEWLCVNM